MKKLIKLFLTFLRIGAFTFGGGYAMIPLIQKEMVDSKKWISNEEILEVIAISESTPGPISVNAATFIGYKVYGFFGAFISTFALILPAFCIMFLISFVLGKFQNNEIVQYAFLGIRSGVIALIINSLIKMYKQINKNLLTYFIMILSFILSIFVNMNTIFIIMICAVFGLLFSSKVERRKMK